MLPRTIYFLWYQGLDQAPLVVRKCLESWKEKNPSWEIVVLDRGNLESHVRLEVPAEKLARLEKNHLADLVRVYLLAGYGGVWVDATVYCMRPLDEWLHGCMHNGFFCFHRPGPDRLMSSWFLAAAGSNPIPAKMKVEFTKYWASHSFDLGPRFKGRPGKAVVRKAERWFNRNERSTRHWFSPFVTRLLRIYPYFAFHYLFAKIVTEDPACREVWSRTKKISADGPHRLQAHGLFAEPDTAIKDEIDQASCPLYKLTWKYDAGRYHKGSVLHYLLEGRDLREEGNTDATADEVVAAASGTH